MPQEDEKREAEEVGKALGPCYVDFSGFTMIDIL